MSTGNFYIFNDARVPKNISFQTYENSEQVEFFTAKCPNCAVYIRFFPEEENQVPVASDFLCALCAEEQRHNEGGF